MPTSREVGDGGAVSTTVGGNSGGLKTWLRSRWARRDSDKTQTDRIGMAYARGPSALTQDPLDTYQRLNLSGHDHKGQLSSGYGQAGYGMSLGVGVDLGMLILPGIVRVPVEIGGGWEQALHTVMVMVRFPNAMQSRSYLYRDFVDERRHAPPGTYGPRIEEALAKQTRRLPRKIWSSSRPLVIMTLRGSRSAGTVRASAGAAVGLGDPTQAGDEFTPTGAASVKVKMSGTVSVTTLVDERPRSYRSAYATTDVDAPWQEPENLAAYVNHELEGDVKRRIVTWIATKGADPDTRKLVQGWAAVEDRLQDHLGPGEDAVDWAVTRWEKLGGIPKPSIDPTGAFAQFSGLVETRPSTKQLDAALEALAKALAQHAVTSRAAGEWSTHDETLLASDLATITDLRERLAARKGRKDAGEAPQESLPGQANHRKPEDGHAAGYLQIGSRSFHASGGGAAKVELGGGAHASLGAAYDGKQAEWHFQTVSLPEDGQVPLVFTQQTQLVQRVRTVEKVAGLKGVENAQFGKLTHYGTVTYRSACAYWRDKPDSGKVTAHALPNGSGCSFGVSMQARELDRYAEACQADSPTITGPAASTEQLLANALGVAPSKLRHLFSKYEFVGAITQGNGLADTSVIVESSFSLNEREEVPLLDMSSAARGGTASRHRLGDLFQTSWVNERHKATGAAREGELTDLSALRVRYRIRRDSDNTRALLTLGFGGTAVGVERVERVGAEGIVDLHVHFFPGPQPPLNSFGYELAVPGVALFSQ